MTIFVRTAQALIDRVLNKSIEDSIAGDNGMIYGWFRDTKNSEQQRNVTRTLQKLVADFEPADTDKQNLVNLQDLISKTDGAIEKLRALKSWNRGGLNDTLSALNSSLDRFYRYLGEKSETSEKSDKKLFTFIDVADDDDPFNLLCAHAAYYLGEHIICPPEEGMLVKIYEKVANTISNATAIEIRSKKEECLMKNILNCKKKLEGLDPDKPDYKELRKTFVIEAIQAIHRENAEICEESKPIDSIPVQVTLIAVARVKAPTIKPSRGRLKNAMDNAFEEIEARALDKKEKDVEKSALTL
ncbi:hypothetical protein [Legionella sp. WA2022007384]